MPWTFALGPRTCLSIFADGEKEDEVDVQEEVVASRERLYSPKLHTIAIPYDDRVWTSR